MGNILIVLAGAFALAVLYVVGRWGGSTLATHHNDAREFGATALLGVCVLGALAIVSRVELPTATLALVALAIGGGLFAGYARIE